MRTEETTEYHGNTHIRLGRGDVTGKVPGKDGLSLERQVLTRQKWVGRSGAGHFLSKGPEAAVPGAG